MKDCAHCGLDIIDIIMIARQEVFVKKISTLILKQCDLFLIKPGGVYYCWIVHKSFFFGIYYIELT